MRAKAKLIAPRELEPRAEHPHRCTAGHRWQHDGPAATTCRLPSYDPVSGDLPYVERLDCPLCSGRNDLLVRKRHTHYCNICDRDWEHEGHCLDSLAACCPWCFPKLDAEAMPGARSGPHFHVCADCGQNWRHTTGCGEPLRAALAECPWCQSADTPIEAGADGVDVVGANRIEVHNGDTAAVAIAAVAAEPSRGNPSRAMPSVGAPAMRVGRRIRRVARAIGIAALVLLPIGIALVLRGHSAFKSPGEVSEEPAREERLAAPSPEPALPATASPAPSSAPASPAPLSPTPPVPPVPAPEPAKPLAEITPPTTRTPPQDVAGIPPAPRTPAPAKAPTPAPASDRVVEPRIQEPRPQALRPPRPHAP